MHVVRLEIINTIHKLSDKIKGIPAWKTNFWYVVEHKKVCKNVLYLIV